MVKKKKNKPTKKKVKGKKKLTFKEEMEKEGREFTEGIKDILKGGKV